MERPVRFLSLSFGVIPLLAIGGFWGWQGVHRAPALNSYGALPAFEMTAVNSSPNTTRVTPSDLRGHPWVANFIFTHCSGPCPLLSSKMAELQKRLPATVRLVTFTVDPDRDTPQRLREYAQAFHADPQRWTFLRGDTGALYKLMYEGFKLPLVQDPSAPSGFRVTHSTRFVLVDSQGVIRGYYDSGEDDFLDRIQHDTTQLLKDPS